MIAGQLGLGGAEQQLYHLVSQLNRAAFEPLVISLGARAAEHWQQPIERAGVQVVHVPRVSGRAERVLRVAATLRSAHADVVHGWAFHTNFYAAAAGQLAGVPIRIGSMRESYDGLPPNPVWRWAGVRGVQTLITNSRVNAESLRGYFRAPGRICVVPNGIVLPAKADADVRAALKAQLGLRPADRIVGTIGRLDQNKNHRLLLHACAALQRADPNLHVVVIGEGSLRQDLEAEARRLGSGARVHFIGAIAGASRFMPAFDVCCLTSDTEGMPNVLMEASAAAVPVVATDCGGSRELVEHGVTGYVVPRGEASALARHIGELLRSPDLARRCGDAGRERMRREFSVAVMVDRMSDVYRGELARRRSPPPHVYDGTVHGISQR